MVVEYGEEYGWLDMAHNYWRRGFGGSLYSRNPDMAWDLEMVS
jgi:hypothetical protein